LVALHEDGVSLFLPNGKVLPANRAKTWKALQAALKQEGGFPKTLGQFRKWLVPQVEMMLMRHGKWEKGVWPIFDNPTAFFRNDGNESCIYIMIVAREDAGNFAFDIEFFIVNDHVKNICNKFDFLLPEGVVMGGLRPQF